MPREAVAPITAVETRVLNGVVRRDNKQHRFLKDLLFPASTHLPINKETVQIDQLYFDPIMAPFVEVNGEAVMLSRENGDSYTVLTPFISLKQPLTASSELLQRFAGQQPILTNETGDDIALQNLERQIAEDTRLMNTSVGEREEWMVAQVLRGEILYSVENRADIKVTFAKPAGNTVVPDNYWDSGNGTFLTDIQDIKRLQNTNNGPNLTDAICSTEAAQAIEAAVEAGDLAYDRERYVGTGEFEAFMNNYDEAGVIYLGRIGNIRFWEYGESVKEEDRTTTEKLIRPGYIEFVSRTQRFLDMNKLYYGVILDTEAMRKGLHVAKRFTKVKEQDDPSAYIQYMKSRPLPVFKRPDWNISFEAVSVP